MEMRIVFSDVISLSCLELRNVTYEITSHEDADYEANIDVHSHHLWIEEGGNIVAYNRVTPGPFSVLSLRSEGNTATPTGPNVVELSRAFVVPQWRNVGFFSFLALQTISCVIDRFPNCRDIALVVEPLEHRLRHLTDIGFLMIGKPLVYYDRKGVPRLGQGMYLPVATSKRHVENDRRNKFDSLRTKGILISAANEGVQLDAGVASAADARL